jgi:cell division protein FtsI (penicillin-binding protein 3)
MRAMMREVVWGTKGTAQALKDSDVAIAGKTGTCYVVENGKYTNKQRLAFCGFFPYEDPQYTCMVLISGANRGAARSSGMVLKNTALRMYARGMLGHNSNYAENNSEIERRPKVFHSANASENVYLAEYGVNNPQVLAKQVTTVESVMPNVMGLPAAEALSILENKGYSVKLNGSGIVVKQELSKNNTEAGVSPEIILTLGLYL